MIGGTDWIVDWGGTIRVDGIEQQLETSVDGYRARFSHLRQPCTEIELKIPAKPVNFGGDKRVLGIAVATMPYGD